MNARFADDPAPKGQRIARSLHAVVCTTYYFVVVS